MYKHWEKIALALTAFFWGGCNDNSSSSEEPTACSLTIGCPEYGVAGYYCEDGLHPNDNGQNCTYQPPPKCQKYYHCEDGVSCCENENTFPTIAQDTPHAVDPSASSDSHIESSSEKAVESSSSEAKAPSSSSELTQVMPAYGVNDKVSCYLDDKDKGIKASTSSRGVFEYSYHCENGVNCVARDSVTGYEPEYPCKEDSITKQMICLDYGVIATTETTISCDDGKTYSEEEFRKQYNRLYTIKNNQDESSSSVAESSSSLKTCKKI